MRVLKDIYMDVKDGWFYVVPETGYRCEGTTLSSLTNQVLKHCIANNLDMHNDLTLRIQNQIANRIPSEFSKEIGA